MRDRISKYNFVITAFATLLAAWQLNTTLAAPKPSAAVHLDRILVIINDDIITQSELNERLIITKSRLSKRSISLPSDSVLSQQVLDAMILEHLQLNHATTLGLTASENQVTNALETLARQNYDNVKSFLKKAQKDNISEKSIRQDIQKQIILKQLANRIVNSQVVVSEHEIDTYLDERVSQGSVTEYNFSHILISLPDTASDAIRRKAKNLANSIHKKLSRGQSFERLAIAHSKGPNALKGGEIGWRESGRLPDIFVQALKTLRPGKFSQILESANGYHILRLNKQRGSSVNAVVKQTQARHILLRPNAIMNKKDAINRLHILRTRILAGESFDDIARAHSNDLGSASQGGHLGWISAGQLVPEFETVMENLKPGEISKPVSTRFGVHLIQVLKRRHKDVGAEQQRLSARQTIRARKAEEHLQKWLRELRDQAYVEMVPKTLN